MGVVKQPYWMGLAEDISSENGEEEVSRRSSVSMLKSPMILKSFRVVAANERRVRNSFRKTLKGCDLTVGILIELQISCK